MSAADPRPAAPEARAPDAPCSDAELIDRLAVEYSYRVKEAVDDEMAADLAGVVYRLGRIAAALRAQPAGEPSEAVREMDGVLEVLRWAMTWVPRPTHRTRGNEEHCDNYAVAQSWLDGTRAAPPPEGTEHE